MLDHALGPARDRNVALPVRERFNKFPEIARQYSSCLNTKIIILAVRLT